VLREREREREREGFENRVGEGKRKRMKGIYRGK